MTANPEELNLKKLHFALGENGEGGVEYAESLGLLPLSRRCTSCGNLMIKTKSEKVLSKFKWRCRRPCRKELCFLTGTFFEGTNLQIAKIIEFIYYWAHEQCSFKTIQRELGFAEHTFVDWRSFLREVCALKIMSENVRLGGPGHEVQIDESLFARRKYHVGRYVKEQWIFGAIDCVTKDCILVPVNQRDQNTLLPIIAHYILPGSRIVSDGWAAYINISSLGYEHLVVNHSEHFVDPDTGAYTQRVENMWMRAKMRNKKECGTARHLLDDYLSEFMWRSKYGKSSFSNILEHIKQFYFPN